MPPKRLGGGAQRKDGYLSGVYRSVTASENQAVVRSVAVFGFAVALFASSWSEYLLPPL